MTTNKVLVLCHGNKMRSPSAEAVLRACGMDVESAGFRISSKRAVKKVRDYMAGRGFDLEQHVPRLVTMEMVRNADHVLYMDGGNLRRLKELVASEPEHLERAHCLGKWGGLKRIKDPAFIPKGDPEFGMVMNLIIQCSQAFAAEVVR